MMVSSISTKLSSIVQLIKNLGNYKSTIDLQFMGQLQVESKYMRLGAIRIFTGPSSY